MENSASRIYGSASFMRSLHPLKGMHNELVGGGEILYFSETWMFYVIPDKAGILELTQLFSREWQDMPHKLAQISEISCVIPLRIILWLLLNTNPFLSPQHAKDDTVLQMEGINRYNNKNSCEYLTRGCPWTPETVYSGLKPYQLFILYQF